uniref:Uncharacterized protein n=1 Tax=Anguilla anguilla TaxID=7936 RepID=A0A0E9X216_ANGAN
MFNHSIFHKLVLIVTFLQGLMTLHSCLQVVLIYKFYRSKQGPSFTFLKVNPRWESRMYKHIQTVFTVYFKIPIFWEKYQYSKTQTFECG